MAASIKVLIAAKEKYFRRIQQTYDLIAKFKTDRNAVPNFEVRYELFDETVQLYYETVARINETELKADATFKPSFDETDAFDTLCCQIKYHYNGIQAAKRSSQTTPGSSTGSTPAASVKIPKFNIPDFDGDPEAWVAFQELYNECVHNNTALTDAEKAHLLFSKLKGKALAVVSGITPSGSNYAILRKALLDKYNDSRFIAHALFKKMLNFKTESSETAKGLELFLESFVASKNALKNLNLADLADFLFLELALTKLHKDTLEVFETAKSGTAMPSFDDLVKSVKSRIKVLERSETENATVKVKKDFKDANKKSDNPNPLKSFHVSDTSKKGTSPPANRVSPVSGENKGNVKPTICGFCKKSNHLIYSCSDFRNLSVTDRIKFVESNGLCSNCFSSIHQTAECKSKHSCHVCGSRHHTMLHQDKPQPPSQFNGCTATPSALQSGSVVLLPTAYIHARDAVGRIHRFRMLLDSGSQAPVISSHVAKTLGLQRQPTSETIVGIGGADCPVRGKACLKFSPHFDASTQLSVDGLIIDRISADVTPTPIAVEQFKGLSHLIMADDYQKTPDRIDVAVGTEYFARMIQDGHVHGPDKSWVALSTMLGYVIMGRVPAAVGNAGTTSTAFFVEAAPLEEMVQRFWSLEEFPGEKPRSAEDRACEEHFKDTHTRDESGRFIVALPFKESPAALGDSKAMAERRFASLERRFAADGIFHQQYGAAIEDLINRNYLSPIAENSETVPEPVKPYYIPHHAVFRPDSATTPVRIVFDASAKSLSGKSLNDILHIGPKLQVDIFSLLLNFRLFPVALIGDLSKMYLQIYVREEDRKFQRMLWRFSKEQPIQEYELNRVVFGIKSSPYLALRCIQALAEAEGQAFPLAREVIPRDMYVDDLVTSVENVAIAKQLVPELEALFRRGGFTLTKFRTNEASVLKSEEEAQAYEFDPGTHAKVLGLQWDPGQDTFGFPTTEWTPTCTKRTVLSTVARIFDPLSLLSPATICLKIMIKELWSLKVDWDEEPPSHVAEAWTGFAEEWEDLSRYSIPRHVAVWPGTKISIIGFADASTKAYGAAVYLRCEHESGSTDVNLLCSKSHVAPQKPVTLARLELCAAVILARLIEAVKNAYQPRIAIERTYAFSDSMVALWWIRGEPTNWKTFVCHRVGKIQSKMDIQDFYHVGTQDNAADCLSRGLPPRQLMNSNMWWHGPEWLTAKEPSKWPIRSLDDLDAMDLPEQVPIKVAVLQAQAEKDKLLALAWHFSKWTKFKNSVVYVLRILGILKPLVGPITAEEILEAQRRIIKAVQRKHFASEIVALERQEECSPWLLKLRPFLDNGILRVGGRLRNADLDFNQKHPVLLPYKDHITDLIIAHYHESNFHTGPSLVTSLVRQKFWILNIRNKVRHQIRKCNWCFRRKPTVRYPLMGDLPAERVKEASAFEFTGIDYAGPFSITFKRTRGNRALTKCYICVFVCFATKAIHLELCSDLSTDVFIGALKRFLARRGTCRILFSDQGTNFIGAKNQLGELYDFLESPEYKDQFNFELTQQRIEFRLNPPGAPHMGGLWESTVKRVKTHLQKVLGEQHLTYEEFSTVLAQVECLLNSRPLYQDTSDPSDPRPITPAHFLVGKPLLQLPDEEVPNVNLNRLTRPKLLSALVQQFWTRWHKEYLHTLQERKKWVKDQPAVKTGDVVILQEPNTPPLSWPLGIIEEVFPGADGVVRVVNVRTTKGTYRRPVVKVAVLPTQ